MSSQSDLLEHFRLETEFQPDHVVHFTYPPGPTGGWRKEKIAQKWVTGGRLGSGGFGSVHRQDLEGGREPAVRAVKEIAKRQLQGVNYVHEVLALAKLSKARSCRPMMTRIMLNCGLGPPSVCPVPWLVRERQLSLPCYGISALW